MLTKFFQSINWVDVGLVLFFIRTVLFSVKSGFVAEGFKFLSTLTALFVSLHCYSSLASLLSKSTKFSLENLEFTVFIVLWLVVTIIFLLIYKGIILLFKIEPNLKVIDKYAAGFLGATRGIFLSSLSIFALLLTHNTYLMHQTYESYAYALTAKTAPNTYSLGFNNLWSKIFEGQKFNDNVFAVIGRHGINPK